MQFTKEWRFSESRWPGIGRRYIAGPKNYYHRLTVSVRGFELGLLGGKIHPKLWQISIVILYKVSNSTKRTVQRRSVDWEIFADKSRRSLELILNFWGCGSFSDRFHNRGKPTKWRISAEIVRWHYFNIRSKPQNHILSVCRPLCPSVYLCTYPSICMSICRSVYLWPVCLYDSIIMSVC